MIAVLLVLILSTPSWAAPKNKAVPETEQYAFIYCEQLTYFTKDDYAAGRTDKPRVINFCRPNPSLDSQVVRYEERLAEEAKKQKKK